MLVMGGLPGGGVTCEMVRMEQVDRKELALSKVGVCGNDGAEEPDGR